ncbi:hypothetical protein P4S64_19760 [Vibrio sp. M60_M31a]
MNGRRINSQDALIRGNDFDLSTIPLTALNVSKWCAARFLLCTVQEAMGGVVNVIL